jgi:hypothetical protein
VGKATALQELHGGGGKFVFAQNWGYVKLSSQNHFLLIEVTIFQKHKGVLWKVAHSLFRHLLLLYTA